MAFKTIALSDIPKRINKQVDLTKANELLTAVQSAPDTGATDGIAYKTDAEARKVGQRNRRLLSRVTPNGQAARLRVFEMERGSGKWYWAVLLAAESADK